LLQAPIAVAEAQAYLYSARLELASLADMLGHNAMANKLRDDAAMLKQMFERDFWMPDQQFACIALDAQNKKGDVISSNAGHCLWTGILDPDKANAVADRLMQRDMHSGWGIRTLSRSTVAFNPVSYHNGSIWPHDNAIIGEGMRKLGRIEDVMKIMDGIAQVSMVDEEHRLPELFCGFDRNGDQRPIEYPVSCSPQAWAAGSLLHMLSACLNFQPDAINQCLKIVEPALPEWVGLITLRGLKIGNAELDLQFESQHGNTYAKILRKTGKLKIIVEN
jgi:glycogen debranching enzyme